MKSYKDLLGEHIKVDRAPYTGTYYYGILVSMNEDIGYGVMTYLSSYKNLETGKIETYQRDMTIRARDIQLL